MEFIKLKSYSRVKRKLTLLKNTLLEYKQGRKRPLDTPKKMIERWEREKEREREKGRRRDIGREGELREREREVKGIKRGEWKGEA